VLESVSRVRDDVLTPEERDTANQYLRLESAYQQHEDLITVGAYKPGVDRFVDAAIALRPVMRGFLRQAPEEGSAYETTRERLAEAMAGAPGSGGDL
jgi:flagellar biosynthesis/type III secretory pathway ATPase